MTERVSGSSPTSSTSSASPPDVEEEGSWAEELGATPDASSAGPAGPAGSTGPASSADDVTSTTTLGASPEAGSDDSSWFNGVKAGGIQVYYESGEAPQPEEGEVVIDFGNDRHIVVDEDAMINKEFFEELLVTIYGDEIPEEDLERILGKFDLETRDSAGEISIGDAFEEVLEMDIGQIISKETGLPQPSYPSHSAEDIAELAQSDPDGVKNGIFQDLPPSVLEEIEDTKEDILQSTREGTDPTQIVIDMLETVQEDANSYGHHRMSGIAMIAAYSGMMELMSDAGAPMAGDILEGVRQYNIQNGGGAGTLVSVAMVLNGPELAENFHDTKDGAQSDMKEKLKNRDWDGLTEEWNNHGNKGFWRYTYDHDSPFGMLVSRANGYGEGTDEFNKASDRLGVVSRWDYSDWYKGGDSPDDDSSYDWVD